MKNTFLYFILLLATQAFSQEEASVWYFGNNAGIKFNTDGSVTAITDGKLNTLEGCATLSDCYGNLLFYTDGITVYNKNHQIMLNGMGLKGNSSSTQSATIIQKPGSSNLYYIFTTPVTRNGSADGLQYSVVDITLDGGLGGVTSEKNITIYSPTCEKLAITKHANGIDYWIVSHGLNNNSFYSYLLSSSGINTTPKISKVGSVVVGDVNGYNVQGYLKISPNGKKIVACHQFTGASGGTGTVELFDFDNASGGLSNMQILESNEAQPYGAEFSPNGNLLYVTFMSSGKIYQYNVKAANVASSKLLLVQIPAAIGALQLGPNNKIYIAIADTKKLGVINNPNELGISCNLQQYIIDLAGQKASFGLPAFNQSFFNQSFEVENFCSGTETQFTYTSSQEITSIVWDFGDGTTSVGETKPKHIFATGGNYKVSVTTISNCKTRTITQDVVINTTPIIGNIVAHQNVFGSSSIAYLLTQWNNALLGSQSSSAYGVSYFSTLNDATTAQNALPSTFNLPLGETTFYARVFNKINPTCFVTTSFTVTLAPTPIANTPTDIILCDDSSNDGKEYFDFGNVMAQVIGTQNASKYSVSFFESQSDADVGNSSIGVNYLNTSNPQTIYVRIYENAAPNFYATTSFQISVSKTPIANPIFDASFCDIGNDGKEWIDISVLKASILGTQSTLDFDVSFFLTESDASNSQNILPSLYELTFGAKTLYAKIFNKNNPNCFVIYGFSVSLNQVPKAYKPKDLLLCDDSSNDGIAYFDLQNVTSEILASQSAGQFKVSYYTTQNDAETAGPPLPNTYQNISNPQTIFARIDNLQNADCYETTSFLIGVRQKPIANQPPSLSLCDDESNDGKEVFDLSPQTAAVLGNQSNSDFSVTYHFSQNEAKAGIGGINSIATFLNTANPQTIFVRIENNFSSSCFDTTDFQLLVRPKPALSLSEAYTICEGKSIMITAPPGYSFYQWSNGAIGQNTTITQPGEYSLTVNNNFGDAVCTTTENFTVYKSNVASLIKIDTQDWTDNQNMISIQASGDGDYEYSLDGYNYQDNPVFRDLNSGSYTVYVNDKKGCGYTTEEVFILMYPKFFTPNNDGYNDSWHIKFSNIEPNMVLDIYDRYGKLIKRFFSDNDGWDGTYNGRLLPSDDYWFVVKRQNGKEFRGHFSLKR